MILVKKNKKKIIGPSGRDRCFSARDIAIVGYYLLLENKAGKLFHGKRFLDQSLHALTP